ncbi:hypothetical protein V493_00371 [Pseudogymnoascus sp. VKM F-4281 (FW-2241)]|nr:hypothetical protein V493_00371 [Pseudogymnoascus sp. VKM F-4281 (FW-2241)]
MDREYKHVTKEQVENFMKYGFLRLENCFPAEKAQDWTKNVWQRLGMDPNDKSTWTSERTNMPMHRTESVETFAPKAWNAICELLGGEERVAKESAAWGDSLIVNLGTPEWEGKFPHPKELDGWHVDGDFFMHYLDSKEQGLLVIPLFTDIRDNCGGTMICPDAIPHIAKHLYTHPDGVSPLMVPRGEQPKHNDLGWYSEVVNQCSDFREMTGSIGDVILMHPLMVHSASRNSLRVPRMITNPRVEIKEHFNFDRENPKDYSLVELKTLESLGKERLEGWKATGPREAVIPERVKNQERMKKLELERLKQNSQAVAV